jgi:hypothetical protein
VRRWAQPQGFNVGAMSGQSGERAARRAAAEVVGSYHERELGKLLEHVREALVRRDAGEVDAFDVDSLIHRYTQSARRLWNFCTVGGSQLERLASELERMQAEGDSIDWWAAAERGAKT